MQVFPKKRVRQSLYSGIKYEHIYTQEEENEYYTRVSNGEHPAKVIAEIDKRLTEEDWVLITEE